MAKTRLITVDQSMAGQRVDAFLAKEFSDLSRSRVQDLLQKGLIKCHGKNLKSSYKIQVNDAIHVVIPEAEPSHLVAQPIKIDVLFEDKDIVVINKPAGLVVHPGAGNKSGTLVNALIHMFPDMEVKNSHRPGLVHRLDKETSGVLVCARNDFAFQNLALQFKSRTVRKIYLAFCLGSFKQTKFELITGHARHKTDRKRFTTKIAPPNEMHSGVRLAHSKFEVLLEAAGVSFIRVELLTGRTHQIRAHLADIQHPLLQDSLYGGRERLKSLKDASLRDAIVGLKRHALHAHSLEFLHPVSGKKLHFESELPPDLRAIYEAMNMLDAKHDG